MSASEYNLAVMRDEFMRIAYQGKFQRWSDATLTDAYFLRLINEAQRVFIDHFQLPYEDDSSFDVVDGTASYTLPANIMGSRVYRVAVKYDGTNWTNLERRNYPFPDGVSESRPLFFAIDPTNSHKIILHPTPGTDITDGLKVFYGRVPAPLSRLWVPTGTTAAITYNTTAVTLSAAASSGAIAVGDQFGVCRTSQSDGESVVVGETPVLWYEISAIDGTSITLSTAFEEPTETVANFVIAQVPDVESYAPGRAGFTLAWYAAGLDLRARAPERADQVMQMAIQHMQSYISDEDGTDLHIGRSPNAMIADNFRG